MIQIEHLNKTYVSRQGETHIALTDINLTIDDGSVFGIIGQSGAGKSTLVRCLNLLERPTSGSIIINGRDITSLSEKELREFRSSVSMVFQNFSLLQQRTVLRNVMFPLELRHADKKEAGAALLTMCQTMLSPEATQVGGYRGLTLELAFDTFAREYRLTMIGQLRHTVTLGTDVFGNLQRMDNALEGLPIKEQACREQLSNLQTQLETAKAEVQKPFPRETELNTKTARLEELNSLLNLDHKEPEIVDAGPDEDQRPPERRRPQLER